MTIGIVLLSVRDAAAVLGLKSRGSIYRKIKSGELPTTPGPDGPMIERDGLEELWGNITRSRSDSPRVARRAVRSVVDMAPISVPAPPPRQDAELPEYNESRKRSEYERANLLELERQQKEKMLLRREDVEQAWNGAVNITRTKVLGVPSRAKQQIPHLSPDEVELIRDLLREALEELAAGEVTA